MEELRGFSNEQVRNWMEHTLNCDALLTKVATMKNLDFWDAVIKNSLVMEMVDSVLSIYPRNFEPEEMRKYFGLRDDVKELMCRLKIATDKILMKIALTKEKVEILHRKGLLSAAGILKMAPIVDAKNQDGVVNKLLKASKELNTEFEQYCVRLSEDLVTIDRQLEQLVEKEERDVTPKESVFVARILGVSVDLFASLIAAFDSSKSARQAIVRSHFIQQFPSFIENTLNFLENATLEKFSLPRGLCRLDRLKAKRDQLAKLAVDLFKRIYTDSDMYSVERLRILEQVVFFGEFLVLLNATMPVEAAVDDLMMNRTCGHDMKTLVAECLAEAESRKQEEEEQDSTESQSSVEPKKSKGYVPRTLDEFSDVRKVEIYSMVTEIHEMLPQISRDAIMECLYHFKFNNEQTLNALLDTDALPDKLRKFVTEGNWENSDSENEPEHAAGASRPFVFSMAPVTPKTKTPEQSARQLEMSKSKEEKRLEEKRQAVDKAVDHLLSDKMDLSQTRDSMKLQAIRNLLLKRKQGLPVGESVEVQCTDGSVLVPMHVGKKKGTRIVTTDAEKRALKEKFSSFAYVMSDDDDKEYDDDEWSDEDEEKAAPPEPKPIIDVQPLNERLQRVTVSSDSESDAESTPDNSKRINSAPRGRGAARGRGGSRGGAGALGNGSKRGGKRGNKKPDENIKAEAPVSARKDGYTGGKQRLLKERRKGQAKQRGADRKRRGGMF